MAYQEDSHPIVSDISVLDCPICLSPLTIPVFQCENGHITCSSCLSRLRKPKCPTCSCSNPGSIRNRAIEKVLESVTDFCAYRSTGCTAGRLTYYAKRLHEQTCTYAPYTCPYFNNCGFMGSPAQLHTHIQKAHPKLCIPIRAFEFYYKKKVTFLFFLDDEGSSVFVLDTRTMKIYSIQEPKETPPPPPQFPCSFLAETHSFQPTTVTCCCANDADWNVDDAACDDAVILDTIFEDCDRIFIQLVDCCDDPMIWE